VLLVKLAGVGVLESAPLLALDRSSSSWVTDRHVGRLVDALWPYKLPQRRIGPHGVLLLFHCDQLYADLANQSSRGRGYAFQPMVWPGDASICPALVTVAFRAVTAAFRAALFLDRHDAEERHSQVELKPLVRHLRGACEPAVSVARLHCSYRAGHVADG